MNKSSKIYIPGHRGLLGSAIVRLLVQGGCSNIITSPRDLDLTNKHTVKNIFEFYRPDYVFLAAAKVGNISNNIKYPVDFLEDNLRIELNVIDSAYRCGVERVLFFGSNCMYPKNCHQPIKEEYLYSGPLEETNRAYALAKLAGLELCLSYNSQFDTDFIVSVPASLYGGNGHFDSGRAHVVADMIHKFHMAKLNRDEGVIFWGDGSPLREFMYVDDAAEAAIFLMNNFNPTDKKDLKQVTINMGTGQECTIFELAHLIAGVVGYSGNINWDISKPNGISRKLLDSSRISGMGWRPKFGLEDGIRNTYKWYCENN